MNSPVALWPATLAFLIVSSILFAWLFEWDRYQVITAYRLHSLSVPDQVLAVLASRRQNLGLVRPLATHGGSLDGIRADADSTARPQLLLDRHLLFHGCRPRCGELHRLSRVGILASHAGDPCTPEASAHAVAYRRTHCRDIGGFRRVRDFRPSVLRLLQTDRNETWPRVPAVAVSAGRRVDDGPVCIRDCGSRAGPVPVQRSGCTGPNFCLFAVSYRGAGSLTVFRRNPQAEVRRFAWHRPLTSPGPSGIQGPGKRVGGRTGRRGIRQRCGQRMSCSP